MNVNHQLIQRYTLRTSPYRTAEHTSSNHWDYTKCEIMEHHPDEPEGAPGKPLGEFIYNYHRTPPWHPFEQDGQHYALYSREYTATRVMSLPDCKDLGGEDRNDFGFCPTGFAVPYFTYEWQPPDPSDPEPVGNPRNDTTKWVQVDDKDRRLLRPGDARYTLPYTVAEYEAAIAAYDAEWKAWDERHPYVQEPFNARFGFVCGCVWGDDTSWKIQFLDLSRIREGIITRHERFGYIELLGDSDSLAGSIQLDSWTPDSPYIGIAAMRQFRTDGREA